MINFLSLLIIVSCNIPQTFFLFSSKSLGSFIDNLILNNLRLIQKNKPNYTFKIENIELQNKETYYKNKYIKNLNKVFFKDIKFNYDSISLFTSIEGKGIITMVVGIGRIGQTRRRA